MGYLQGRTLYVVSIDKALLSKEPDHLAIRRETKLVTFELSYDEQTGVQIAVADDFGKIFHVLNVVEKNGQKGQMIIRTLHWHASAVTSLKFLENTPYLLSAGAEAVVVQWHLEK